MRPSSLKRAEGTECVSTDSIRPPREPTGRESRHLRISDFPTRWRPGVGGDKTQMLNTGCNSVDQVRSCAPVRVRKRRRAPATEVHHILMVPGCTNGRRRRHLRRTLSEGRDDHRVTRRARRTAGKAATARTSRTTACEDTLHQSRETETPQRTLDELVRAATGVAGATTGTDGTPRDEGRGENRTNN